MKKQILKLISLKFIILITFIFSSNLALAGWVSSGGGLYRDAHNSWFVRNTKTVNYCIKVDSSSISASESDIKQIIKDGIEYWGNEFNKVKTSNQNGFYEVGTQVFQESSCLDTNIDIEFLFGYGTLNQTQIQYLKDPTKFVGVSVRTDYDETNLRAKGFVYFSSDIGPNSYDNPGSLISKAWEKPKILKYAILHELGHIFGIPHNGSGLMSEVFLNQILNKNLVSIFEQAEIESYMHPNKRVSSCWLKNESKTFFGVPTNHNCIEIESDLTGKHVVFSKENEKSIANEIGEFRSIQPDIQSYQSKPVSILQLTDAQKVFSIQETAFRNFMVGPTMSQFQAKATFITKANPIPKPVQITIGPSYFSVTATINNKIENVFVYNSPIGVMLSMEPKP